jgi:hypothetical protein
MSIPKRQMSVLGVAAIGLLAGVGSLSHATGWTSRIPGLAKPSGPARLAQLDNPNLPRPQKTQLAAEMLRDEATQATPGAVISASYARAAAQLLQPLDGPDRVALHQLRSASVGEVRQLLSLALVQGGDAEGNADAKGILRDQNAYRLDRRILAAQALARKAEAATDSPEATELGRFLAQVLQDEVQWRPYSGAGKRAGAGEYPVKRIAVAAIRSLQGRAVKLDSYVLAAAQRAVVEFDGPPAEKPTAK